MRCASLYFALLTNAVIHHTASTGTGCTINTGPTLAPKKCRCPEISIFGRSAWEDVQARSQRSMGGTCQPKILQSDTDFLRLPSMCPQNFKVCFKNLSLCPLPPQTSRTGYGLFATQTPFKKGILKLCRPLLYFV